MSYIKIDTTTAEYICKYLDLVDNFLLGYAEIIPDSVGMDQEIHYLRAGDTVQARIRQQIEGARGPLIDAIVEHIGAGCDYPECRCERHCDEGH